jgi:lantibiotic biosynthesis protein
MSLANHALGPEIYDDTSDTSGVAIFLSHLYAVTRNDVFRQTAEGAIKHATSHVHDIDDFFRLGFYDGILGIGYASLKTAGFLDDDRILENAISILECISSNMENGHSIDIISDNAGSIPASWKHMRSYMNPGYMIWL